MEPKPPPMDANRLAFERTWLAHERTLMAWVRTAMSFITFGFSIYKFFAYEQQLGHWRHGVFTPRDFGILMISAGLGGLLLATLQQQRQLRVLEREFEVRRVSTAALVAILVAAIGIVALVATVLRQ